MQQSLIWFRLDETTWVNPCKVTVESPGDIVWLHLPGHEVIVLDKEQSERVIDWLMDMDFDLRPEEEGTITALETKGEGGGWTTKSR